MISPKRSLSELSEPSKKLRRLSESSLSLIEDPGGQTEPLADPCLPSTSSYHHHHVDPVSPEPQEEAEDDDDSNDPHLLSLPLLVLTNIIDDLDVEDVCSLRLVNKFLLKVTETRYIRSVRLSLSPPSSPVSSPAPASSLSVLDLAVTYNLSQLPTGQKIILFCFSFKNSFFCRFDDISSILTAQFTKTEAIKSHRKESYLE